MRRGVCTGEQENNNSGTGSDAVFHNTDIGQGYDGKQRHNGAFNEHLNCSVLSAEGLEIKRQHDEKMQRNPSGWPRHHLTIGDG